MTSLCSENTAIEIITFITETHIMKNTDNYGYINSWSTHYRCICVCFLSVCVHYSPGVISCSPILFMLSSANTHTHTHTPPVSPVLHFTHLQSHTQEQQRGRKTRWHLQQPFRQVHSHFCFSLLTFSLISLSNEDLVRGVLRVCVKWL